jgi:hypothetical protein
MVGSMAWLVLNVLAPPLSPLLSHPLSLLYQAMEKTAFIAGKIPGIRMPPQLVLALSLLLIALILWLDYSRRLARSHVKPFA